MRLTAGPNKKVEGHAAGGEPQAPELTGSALPDGSGIRLVPISVDRIDIGQHQQNIS